MIVFLINNGLNGLLGLNEQLAKIRLIHKIRR